MERLKVKIKPEIKKHCWEQVTNHNFGQRKKYNGDRKQQYLGIVGESVVREMFGFGWVDGKHGCDDGYDIMYNGKTYDVKTMKRTVDVKHSYTNNFIKKQENKNVDGYIFCSWNIRKNELTICGWIKKEDFNIFKRLVPAGTPRKNGKSGVEFKLDTDWYEIDNKYLNFVNSVVDMKMQMISRWENK